jgi:predicted DNA-binding transcriptional regulator AlpA
MSQNQLEIPKYIDSETVAKLTGRSRRTVEKDRLTGFGPNFYKLGRRVLYRLDEVLAWIEKGRRTSTSDPGQVV